MKRLPDTELEVMKALWASGPDTPRAALDHALADFQWSPNTINTYLTRLMEKGFVSVRREGKSNRYTPLISQEDYLASLLLLSMKTDYPRCLLSMDCPGKFCKW